MPGKRGDKDTPPAYEECVSQDILLRTANTNEDGRVEINFDSQLARVLTQVVSSPKETVHSEPPPTNTKSDLQIPLSIVIQVVGSRGDVQPFVALGQQLQRVGHKVRIATHNVFRDFVKQANLGFYPIGGDPNELMAYMVRNPGLIPEIRTLREGEISKKRQMVREMLAGCWKSCIEPDTETGAPFVANAIIANPPSFAHIHCAEALGVPLHVMFTMPWTPTQAFPHPLARLRPSKVGEGMANYLSYGLIQLLTWQGLADVLNKFRKSLSLEPVPFTEGPFLLQTMKVPHTYCWSPSLVPQPHDWPDHIDVCGFFFRSIPEYKPPASLHEFISQGPTPIYIGFGSIVMEDPEAVTEIIIEAVRLAGVRAVVSAGWSKLGGKCTRPMPAIFFLNEDCPHEWLFPRVAAVVHHGGAGTTACGLLNARPTLVVPFFGDQYFWGDMIAKTGAGPSPIRYCDLDSQTLSDAIKFCLLPKVAAAAAAIAKRMKVEDGVSAAVSSFHHNLSNEELVCDVDSSLPASWLCKKSGKKVKLSGLVSEVLLRQGKIKAKDLEPYSPNRIHIINRRWDPSTAVASAVTGTSLEILEAGNSIWKAPYDFLNQQRSIPNSSGGISIPAKNIAAMVGASAMSIPRIYGALAKGFLLDLPLAVTEGLRATPKIYGADVPILDPVTDWKSGSIVAGKMFVTNLRTSATDLYTLPAAGLEAEGAVGLGKGIGKSVVGAFANSGSALTGLIAYPALGLSKSIHSTFYTGTRKAIMLAKRDEGRFLVDKMEEAGDLRGADWVRAFEKMF